MIDHDIACLSGTYGHSYVLVVHLNQFIKHLVRLDTAIVIGEEGRPLQEFGVTEAALRGKVSVVVAT